MCVGMCMVCMAYITNDVFCAKSQNICVGVSAFGSSGVSHMCDGLPTFHQVTLNHATVNHRHLITQSRIIT